MTKKKEKTETREPEVRKKSVTLDLPCKLKKDEIVERKNDLLKKLDERDKVSLESKTVASNFRAQLKVLDNKITQIRSALRTDEEKRPTLCDQHYDWKKKTVTVYRADTGARVHERAMHKNETQKTVDEAVEDAKSKKATQKKSGDVLPMTRK